MKFTLLFTGPAVILSKTPYHEKWDGEAVLTMLFAMVHTFV